MNELMEKRNNLLDEMDTLLNGAKAETRAFTNEETTRFDEIKAEIAQIDKTLTAEEESRSYEKKEVTKMNPEQETRALEEKNFVAFIRGEERALDVANNGGIVPKTVAKQIITKVKELSPILSLSTVFDVGGDILFPVYDETSSSISAAYTDELAELTEGNGKFTTVKLESFIVGVLAKVSKSLVNRTDIDVLNFVINEVATKIAEFLEKEMLTGTTKMQGVVNATKVVTTGAASAITSDELVDLQLSVPQRHQAKAVFIMNPITFKAVAKLKNDNGEYLLQKDFREGFGYQLLGKPVYTSENMPVIATGNAVVAYGDMSGLYVKFAQNIEVQILKEKFATQHVLGVVAYAEVDSKIVEQDKLAVLKMA